MGGEGPEQNMRKCTRLGMYPIFSAVTFDVACIQNHVWVSLLTRVMSIFVKTYVCVKVELGDNHG